MRRAGWLYLRGVGVGEGGAQGIRISRQVLGLGSSVAGHGQNQLQEKNKSDEQELINPPERGCRISTYMLIAKLCREMCAR